MKKELGRTAFVLVHQHGRRFYDLWLFEYEGALA